MESVDTMTIIAISDALHKRLVIVAKQRGEHLDTLVQHALEIYLARLEDTHVDHEARETGTSTKEIHHGLETPKVQPAVSDQATFMALLEAARGEYAMSGESWLDWDGIDSEVAERRGGYRWEAE
jgi:predicted DNA-binding protein